MVRSAVLTMGCSLSRVLADSPASVISRPRSLFFALVPILEQLFWMSIGFSVAQWFHGEIDESWCTFSPIILLRPMACFHPSTLPNASLRSSANPKRNARAVPLLLPLRAAHGGRLAKVAPASSRSGPLPFTRPTTPGDAVASRGFDWRQCSAMHALMTSLHRA